LSQPDVTIVIPAWGFYAGEPLEQALASLRSQDVPARIVLVDNASEEPLEARPDVELVRSEERLTVGAARNLGLERVTTDYCLSWDADDLMLPGTLRFLLDEITSEERVVAVAAGIVEDVDGRRHHWPPVWSARLARRPRLFAVCHSVWSLFPSTGATIMRTQPVIESGGYSAGASAEDWVLGVSLAFRGRVLQHERPGRVYRRLGASLWDEHRSPRRQLEHAAAVRARLATDRGIPSWARRLALPLKVLHPAILLGAAPLARRIRALLPRRG
jgi:glycosyltransferase involved in cell wall biosynthesis